MVYAVILAGGAGTRMGNTDMPKQFLMLGNKPIFIHTIEQFLLNSQINKIIICCPKAWMNHAKDTIVKYLGENSNIIVVEGGKTRSDTILNGCNYILEEYGIQDDDIVITHDAVRPFVTQRIIEDNIKQAKKTGAVDTVIEATDTIVESKDGNLISNIPVRKEMYQGQTPQSFNLKSLINILGTLTEEEKEIITEACKAFLIKGKKVSLVKGEVYNIKITTMHDLKISNSILAERGNK